MLQTFLTSTYLVGTWTCNEQYIFGRAKLAQYQALQSVLKLLLVTIKRYQISLKWKARPSVYSTIMPWIDVLDPSDFILNSLFCNTWCPWLWSRRECTCTLIMIYLFIVVPDIISAQIKEVILHRPLYIFHSKHIEQFYVVYNGKDR